MITHFPSPITAILHNGSRAAVIGLDEALNLVGANGEIWSREGHSSPATNGTNDIVGRVMPDGRVTIVHPEIFIPPLATLLALRLPLRPSAP